jgi:hypothetical protein
MSISITRFTRLNIASAFIALATILYFVLSNLPNSIATLNIESTSSRPGVSQVFFNVNNSYSESATTLRAFGAGKTTSTFALTTIKSPLRWDPSQNDGEIVVNNIAISLFGFEIPSALTIDKLHDIISIDGSLPNVSINITAESNDPQTLISFSDTELNFLQHAVHFFLAIIFGAALTVLLTRGHLILNRLNRLEIKIDSAAEELKNLSLNGRETFNLVLIAAVLNIYFISTFSLSIDDEMGAIRTDSSIWISQGRWAIYLIEKFLFPQPAIPFAPYILLCICLGLSYSLTLKLHQISSSWKTYLTFPVYCAFPTWWFIAEFSSNVPAAALGWLLITIAVLIAFRSATAHSGSVLARPLQRLFLGLGIAFAIACYQSLVLLYTTLSLGAMLTSILKSEDRYSSKAILKKLASLSANLFIGAALYLAINKISLSLSGQQSAYLSNFVKIDELLHHPLDVTLSVIEEMFTIYTGSASRFGASIFFTAPILVISSLTVWFNGKRPFLQVAIWITLLICPFSLHFIAGPENMPIRTMLTLAYCIWLMTFIIIDRPKKICCLTGAFFSCLLTIQILNVSSQYMATATITQQHDRALAADIYSRIGLLSPDFDQNLIITIDIYGHKPFRSLFASGWTSTMTASFFDWDNGNLVRMLAYMRVIGYKNLAMPTAAIRISNISQFANMPVWPAEGSIKKYNNQYLIKLGSDPDPSHAIKINSADEIRGNLQQSSAIPLSNQRD